MSPSASSRASLTGPQRIDGFSVVTRSFLGLLGGIAGFLLILLSIIVTGGLAQNFFADQSTLTGVASFAILTSLFLSATIANLLGTWLQTIANQPKYVRVAEGLMQVVTVNVVLFLFTIGAFLLTQRTDVGLSLAVLAFHLVFSAMASLLVFEITATKWNYPLITVYDGLLGTFITCVLLIVLYAAVDGAGQRFLFGVPLIVWTMLGFVSGLTEYLYYQVYRRMGVDMLQSRQVAAADAPIEDQFEETETEQPF